MAGLTIPDSVDDPGSGWGGWTGYDTSYDTAMTQSTVPTDIVMQGQVSQVPAGTATSSNDSWGAWARNIGSAVVAATIRTQTNTATPNQQQSFGTTQAAALAAQQRQRNMLILIAVGYFMLTRAK